jgi:tetratricopeptide (TPR) repeat protein
MKRRILATTAAGLALLGAAAACTAQGTAGAGANPTASNQVSLLDQGVNQGLAGRYDEANAIFQQIVAADPNNKLAWYDLGYISQVRNDPTTAIADYDRALAADPNYTPAMYNKAILLESSNVDGAIDLYRKILTIDSKASTTHMRLGLLLDRKGDKADARNEFTAAVSIDAGLRSAVPQPYRSGS